MRGEETQRHTHREKPHVIWGRDASDVWAKEPQRERRRTDSSWVPHRAARGPANTSISDFQLPEIRTTASLSQRGQRQGELKEGTPGILPAGSGPIELVGWECVTRFRWWEEWLRGWWGCCGHQWPRGRTTPPWLRRTGPPPEGCCAPSPGGQRGLLSCLET